MCDIGKMLMDHKEGRMWIKLQMVNMRTGGFTGLGERGHTRLSLASEHLTCIC